MSKSQKNLAVAHKNKKDEFYIGLEPIIMELDCYGDYFRDKIVFCNCDDPYKSNYIRAFITGNYGIKRLISLNYKPFTKYKQSSLLDDGETMRAPCISNHVYFADFPQEDLEHGFSDYETFITEHIQILNGTDGSYDSVESEALLNICDVVVTGPPYSLLKKYIPFILNHGKDFLLMVNENVISAKSVYPYFHKGIIRLGKSVRQGGIEFEIPDEYEFYSKTGRIDGNKRFTEFGSNRWLTTLDHGYVPEPLNLTCSYSPDKYPYYRNIEAIEVSETHLIPKDYFGVMGVPLTFLDKWCPDQFELIGSTDGGNFPDRYKKVGYKTSCPIIGNCNKYKRILIKRITSNEQL